MAIALSFCHSRIFMRSSFFLAGWLLEAVNDDSIHDKHSNFNLPLGMCFVGKITTSEHTVIKKDQRNCSVG